MQVALVEGQVPPSILGAPNILATFPGRVIFDPLWAYYPRSENDPLGNVAQNVGAPALNLCHPQFVEFGQFYCCI